MKKVVEIVKEKEITNEYGAKKTHKLTKQYKLLNSGREFDTLYVYEMKYDNGVGGEYKTFKKLANALKYCENIF